MIYQLEVKGEFGKDWSEWLGSIQITSLKQDNGTVTTILTVDVVDQSALFGILDHIRDLNLCLVSVTEDGLDIEP